MPKIAIIGRQNVGKSTLFNALIKRKKSITFNKPGVTRDLISQKVDWGEGSWEITDFPGFENLKLLKKEDTLNIEAIKKAEKKIKDFHLILWVVTRKGLSQYEYELAKVWPNF